MQANRYVVQDPSAKMSWENDWTSFLGDNDSISSRLWTITPLNNTTPETPALTSTTSPIVFVEGLIAGRVYSLTETATMLSGVIEQQTIVIRCENT